MVALSIPPSVLIADADPYIGRVLEAKLVKANRFRVTIATSGADALQAALQQPFSILLWDVRMRDTSGLLSRLRALCPQAAILLMTTDDRPVVDAEMARLDIAGVLVKPFGLDSLVERLYATLTAKRPSTAAASIDLARIGQAIVLDSPGGTCETRVMESGQDTFAVVGAPRVQIPEDFAPGIRVHVQISGEDALYSFASRVVRALEAPVAGWELQMPRLIRRDQRRKVSRYSLNLPILLQVSAAVSSELPYAAPAATSQETGEMTGSVRGLTEEISLGGCALIAPNSLPVGMDVRFSLENDIYGEGAVVRVQPLTDITAATEDPLLRQRIVVRFTSLDQNARNRLHALLVSEKVMR